MKRLIPFFGGRAIQTALLFPVVALALIYTSNEGTWPKNWPAELEPFRKQSESIGVATGVQQDIYQIRFNNREEFEKAWPAILKMKAPNAPLTLYTTNTPATKNWGSALRNDHASVRIYAPSRSFETTNSGGTIDGALPEYVKAADTNQVQWIPVDLEEEIKNRKPPTGFIYRRRINLDLVVDPAIVDLAKLKLPRGTEVRDQRFPIPGLTAEQRKALIQEAQQTFSRHVQVDPKNRTDNIPPQAWGTTMASLKPLRVIDDRVNLKIVLFEADGIEAGFYINIPISSYFPDEDRFLEFLSLSQPDDQSFGQIHRYKEVQTKNHPR